MASPNTLAMRDRHLDTLQRSRENLKVFFFNGERFVTMQIDDAELAWSKVSLEERQALTVRGRVKLWSKERARHLALRRLEHVVPPVKQLRSVPSLAYKAFRAGNVREDQARVLGVCDAEVMRQRKKRRAK